MKVGILCHGYSLENSQNLKFLGRSGFLQEVSTEPWKKVVWGEPPLDYGRVPKAVALALEFKAQVIVFGSGSSKASDGRMEAQVTASFLISNFEKLGDFEELFPKFDLRNYLFLPDYIAEHSILEKESRNTNEESYNSLAIFAAQDINTIIVVSSPDHASRAFRDLYGYCESNPELERFKGNIMVASSRVPYISKPVRDVQIIEPR